MVQYLVIAALLLLACASPLLTWLHLWQVKEWRWDRLREYLRNEGGLHTLFSHSRVSMGCTWAVVGFTVYTEASSGQIPPLLASPMAVAIWLALLPAGLALLSVVQFALRKQPLPRWTMKARLLVIVAVLIDAGIIAGLLSAASAFGKPGEALVMHPYPLSAWLLPYFQPSVAGVAWLVTYPLDRYLKRRIMNRARAIRAAHPKLTVIGITGSVGKTTTKELVAHVLADRKPLMPPDHVNTEMGVSLWIAKTLAPLPADSQAVVVVEMGAYRMGEIALLCSIVQPTIGAITRIAEQHLALFGSREAICKAKGELFAALPETGHAFVNADSPMCAELIARCRCPVTTVATDSKADVSGLDVEETPLGLKFSVGGTTYETGLHGTHNVTNVLLALSVARHLGLEPAAVAKRLKTFAPPKRTFQVRQERGVTVLDDTYNSSPASVAAAVEWARHQPAKRKILVTAGIIELGEAEEKLHREIAYQAQGVFQRAYVIGRKFLPYFTDGGFGPRAELLPGNPPRLEPGDLLVCAGRMSPGAITRFLPHA